MSNRFFSSDLHLGHNNIIKYCNRPFKNIEKMNLSLIRNINNRIKDNDILIHVGDFAFYGREKGIECTRINPNNYINDIKCNVVNIRGNHDYNNRVKSVGVFLITMLGKYKASIAHRPSNQLNFNVNMFKVDVHVCGHVHEKWKYMYINGILNINVGVDVWKFNPIREDELIGYISKIKNNVK